MDMTDNKDEILIERFFNENRITIEDNGFSRRVMNRLPDRARRINRLWTAVCATIAILFIIQNDFFTMLWGSFKGLAADITTSDTLLMNPLIIVMSLLIIIFLSGCKLIASDDYQV